MNTTNNIVQDITMEKINILNNQVDYYNYRKLGDLIKYTDKYRLVTIIKDTFNISYEHSLNIFDIIDTTTQIPENWDDLIKETTMDIFITKVSYFKVGNPLVTFSITINNVMQSIVVDYDTKYDIEKLLSTTSHNNLSQIQLMVIENTIDRMVRGHKDE